MLSINSDASSELINSSCDVLASLRFLPTAGGAVEVLGARAVLSGAGAVMSGAGAAAAADTRVNTAAVVAVLQ